MIDLKAKERHIKAREGEDGIIEYLFQQVGTTDKVFLELGVDGHENTAHLLDIGWSGYWADTRVPRNVPDGVKFIKARVTAENITRLLDEAGLQQEFDFLSLDLDGNDYWVWLYMRHRPRVVCIEYNGCCNPLHSVVMPYNPEHEWDHTNQYGASLAAMDGLASLKGYTLIGCESSGANAFFVRDDVMAGELERATVEEAHVALARPYKPRYLRTREKYDRLRTVPRRRS